jgi:hypothetical protein
MRIPPSFRASVWGTQALNLSLLMRLYGLMKMSSIFDSTVNLFAFTPGQLNEPLNFKARYAFSVLGEELRSAPGTCSPADHPLENRWLPTRIPIKHAAYTSAYSPGNSIPASISRRGRGKRKNKVYWRNVTELYDPKNTFERDCLFADDNGSLSTPAISYMDSTSSIPCCMSMKYLRELGLEAHLSTDFDDPRLISTGLGGEKAKLTGIVRDIAFRLKGASATFRGDFYVSTALDWMYDILFGWQFMCSEAAGVIEKAQDVYRDAKAFLRNAASTLVERMGDIVTETQRRVSDFVGSVSLPPPPYSLVNVLEGDYLITPRVD